MFRGTISGTVTDSSKALVPGVHVVATEVNTGTKAEAVTNGDGHYVLPFLLPGEYSITARMKGFKQYVRQGIQLSAEASLTADIVLEIGSSNQSVVVTADAPLVDTSDASIGQTITTNEVEDLPVNGRTPIMLAELAIGTMNTSDPSQVHPFDNAGASNWSIGGSRSQSSELLMDGAPDMIWNGTLAYSPPQDAVSEVTVKAFDTDAAYGHTGGGIIDQVMKSGPINYTELHTGSGSHPILWETCTSTIVTTSRDSNPLSSNTGSPLEGQSICPSSTMAVINSSGFLRWRS